MTIRSKSYRHTAYTTLTHRGPFSVSTQLFQWRKRGNRNYYQTFTDLTVKIINKTRAGMMDKMERSQKAWWGPGAKPSEAERVAAFQNLENGIQTPLKTIILHVKEHQFFNFSY